MNKIRKLEDLQAWSEARILCRELFNLTKQLPKSETFILISHINANGRHIPANIAEGFGRFYLKDSLQFYRVALGSLNEVKSDLYLCLDRDYITKDEFAPYINRIEKVERLVFGLISSASKVKTSR